MRRLFLSAVATAMATGAGVSHASPAVELRGLAARVKVVPEARSDVQVALLHATARLPVQIRRLGDHVYVTGDVSRRIHGCRNAAGARSVLIWGRGAVGYDDLPLILIRTPPAVRVQAGDAVFGDIGHAASVDLTNKGCGDWTIGDVTGLLRLNQAGSGESRAGSAGSAHLSAAGSGGITAGAIAAGLDALSSGSGDITIASVHGDVDARVAGPGNITLTSGSVTTMSASIAGSGAVTLHGVAGSLRASIAGSGDIRVGRVTGTVSKQVFGSGVVKVGP